MSRIITSDAQRLHIASDLGITDYPYSIFCYYKAPATPSAKFIWQFKNDATDNKYISLDLGASDVVVQRLVEQFTEADSTVGSIAEATWEPCLIVGTTIEHTLYALSETIVINHTQTWQTNDAPGFGIGNGYTGGWAAKGRVAHFTVWAKELSPGDITSIMGGSDPDSIDTVNQAAYWAMTDGTADGDLTDARNSLVLTNVGTTFDNGDNPSFSLPVLSQTAQIDVTITVDGDFPGVAPLTFTQTGDINVALGVNGTQSATKPILTNYTAQFGNTIRVIPASTTDVNNGVMYMVITEEGDVPSVTQIKAGQNSEGNNALASESISISRIGEHIFTEVNSLLGNTEYEVYFVHTSDSNTNSNAYTSGFTTLGYGGGAAPVVVLNQNKKKQIKRKVKKEVERIQKKPFVKSERKKASQESINRIVKAQLKTEDTDNSQIRSLRQEIRSYAKEAFELEISNKAKITKNNMKRKLLILMAI